MRKVCSIACSEPPLEIPAWHIATLNGLGQEPPLASQGHSISALGLSGSCLARHSRGFPGPLPRVARMFRWLPEADSAGPCNSSVTAIAILGTSRAYQLARWHRFVSIEHCEPLQTALQGILTRAMVCRKIADLTQNCHTQPSEPGWCPVPCFPAIHLARQSPFYGLPGHISSRDGIDLCPSSVANPSRHRYKAHRLAR